MKNPQDKFVPYDLALRLKDLGYDDMCFAKYYQQDGGDAFIQIGETEIEEAENAGDDVTFECDAPLWQDAFDWFHDEFELLANIQKLPQNSYHAHIQSTSDEYLELLREHDNICIDEVGDVYTYQDVKLQTLIKLIEYVEKHQTNIQE